MKSFFESLFGDDWFGFSNSFFGYPNRKSIGFDDESLAPSKGLEASDDKYTLNFPINKDLNMDFLKVNVDKSGILTVSYDEKKDNSSVFFQYQRNIPEDAILNTANAEYDGTSLHITFDRDKEKGIEAQPVLSIPINFEED